MCYNLGILIVGSLFWDNGSRKNWRDTNLYLEKRIFVKAPIRYGRKSNKRKDTYTMVISNTCSNDKKIGKAIVVPCIKSITKGQDIIYEAKALWNAECKKKLNTQIKIVSSSWGTVGILKNPSKDYSSDILSDWKKFYNPKEFRHVKFLMCEKRPISNDGILNINWPRRVSDDSSINFDFILATVTAPTYITEIICKRYPNPEEIAQEWIRAQKAQKAQKEVDYFINNWNYGIRTFQDKEILEELIKDSTMRDFLRPRIDIDETLNNE